MLAGGGAGLGTVVHVALPEDRTGWAAGRVRWTAGRGQDALGHRVCRVPALAVLAQDKVGSRQIEVGKRVLDRDLG